MPETDSSALNLLCEMSAVELGQAMDRREVSAVQLVDAFYSRYERLNPLLNSVVAVNPDAARTHAVKSDARASLGCRNSALDGVPVTVKDNIYVAGFPATWGSTLYRDFLPPCDDVGIARLRAAGANLIAKTNTPEFALAAYTDNLLFGPTRNPWNLNLTPGGSSGGAVVALAAGLAPLAVGTDAGGSIRRPASYVGVVGFRPTTGRIPRVFGFPALAHDFQVMAPAARTVDDAYLLFRTMAGPDRRDHASLRFCDYPLPQQIGAIRLPRARIRCVLRIGDSPVDQEVRASVEAGARTLGSLGHYVEEGPPPYDITEIERVWSILSTAGLARVLVREASWHERVHPGSRNTAERGLNVSVQQYIDALDSLHDIRARLEGFFETTDYLLTPASASLPWPLGEPYPRQIGGREASPRGAAQFSTFVNAAELPAVSVPVAPSPDGIPIGMQLVGRFGADLQLLTLAREFEEAAPWSTRFPSVAGGDAKRVNSRGSE